MRPDILRLAIANLEARGEHMAARHLKALLGGQ